MKYLTIIFLLLTFSLNAQINSFEIENNDYYYYKVSENNVKKYLDKSERSKQKALLAGGIGVLTTLMILDSSHPNDLRMARGNFIIFSTISLSFATHSIINYNKARQVQFE